MTPYTLYKIYKSTGNKNAISEDKWKNKLSDKSFNEFQELSDKFTTIWQSINATEYMKTGHSIWKSFIVKNLNNPRILKTYIKNDKNKKRCIDYSEENIYNELLVLKEKYGSIRKYCEVELPIEDFQKNIISSLTLMYLIMYKYVKVDSFEKNYLSYIYDRYDELKQIILTMDSLEVF